MSTPQRDEQQPEGRVAYLKAAPPKPDIPAWLAAQRPSAPRPQDAGRMDAGRMDAASVVRRSPWRRALRDPRAWLGAYVIALVLIAFWPTHVDQGAGPFLAWVSRTVPILTYARIEFSANILLFVPLGALLMLILQKRYLIVPIALVATVTIEAVQSLMGGARTSSIHDVVANLTGACVGMLIPAFAAWATRRRP